MLRRRLLTFYFGISAFPYDNTMSFQEEREIRPKASIAAFSGPKHRSRRRPLNMNTKMLPCTNERKTLLFKECFWSCVGQLGSYPLLQMLTYLSLA